MKKRAEEGEDAKKIPNMILLKQQWSFQMIHFSYCYFDCNCMNCFQLNMSSKAAVHSMLPVL